MNYCQKTRKHLGSLITVWFLSLFIQCSKDLSHPVETCTRQVQSTFNKGVEIQQIIDQYAKKGIPGIAVAIREGSSIWEGTAGFAKIETYELLKPCHLMYSQSIAKTYAATLIMILSEEGKIVLDTPIRKYLPDHIGRRIANSSVITVRMLLNHTSGLYDYVNDLKFVTKLLNNPTKKFTSDYYLGFVLDKPAIFAPGEKYQYVNSNYLVLSLITEFITGKPHHVSLREKILEPLALNCSYYSLELEQPSLPVVNTYWDFFNNNVLENNSETQRNYVKAALGDDGMVAIAADYVEFMHSLAHGELLVPASLKEMKTWVNDEDGVPVYGLGLERVVFENYEGFGHGGEGLGAGGLLYHFPDRDLTFFVGVNVSLMLESKAKLETENLVRELVQLLLNN